MNKHKRNDELLFTCFQIEAYVRLMLLRGINDPQEIVDTINLLFTPQNEFEMEMYSESIIYAKQGVLN
jgi:hypothetical protein